MVYFDALVTCEGNVIFTALIARLQPEMLIVVSPGRALAHVVMQPSRFAFGVVLWIGGFPPLSVASTESTLAVGVKAPVVKANVNLVSVGRGALVVPVPV